MRFCRMPAQTQLVSFRLSADAQRRLTALATAQGMSAGEYARDLVFQKLDQPEQDRAAVDDMKSELSQLRSDLALSVEALLVAVTNPRPVTPEQAKRWVNERLRKSRPEEHPSGPPQEH
jgi:predicted DNA-binding protein